MGKKLNSILTRFATFDYPRQHCQSYVDLVMLMIDKNVYFDWNIWRMVHFIYWGVTGYNFKKNIAFLYLDRVLRTLMKWHIMGHFIWVFSVCKMVSFFLYIASHPREQKNCRYIFAYTDEMTQYTALPVYCFPKINRLCSLVSIIGRCTLYTPGCRMKAYK